MGRYVIMPSHKRGARARVQGEIDAYRAVLPAEPESTRWWQLRARYQQRKRLKALNEMIKAVALESGVDEKYLQPPIEKGEMRRAWFG